MVGRPPPRGPEADLARAVPLERGNLTTNTRREPIAHRSGILRDLARLAVLFLIVALANLLFLLIALSFLAGPPAAR